jgi:hypothetical protein
MQFAAGGLWSAAMTDLFADQELPTRAAEAPSEDAPLADRLRPRSLG